MFVHGDTYYHIGGSGCFEMRVVTPTATKIIGNVQNTLTGDGDKLLTGSCPGHGYNSQQWSKMYGGVQATFWH